MKSTEPSVRELLSSTVWLTLVGATGAVVSLGSADGASRLRLIVVFTGVLLAVAVVCFLGIHRARNRQVPPTRMTVCYYVIPLTAVVIAGLYSDDVVNALGAMFSGIVLGVAVATAVEAAWLASRHSRE